MSQDSPIESLRPAWKGSLKFSLVSIPVQAIPAMHKEGGEIDLDWLHAKCHSHIHNVKTCPIHGKVNNEEIVRGYRVAADQYVVIDPQELDMLRTHSEKVVNIEVLVPPKSVDPLLLTDRSYYLLPDGEVNAKPYVVLQQAMSRQQHWGVAQVTLFRREQMVLVRPLGKLLVMTVLSYANQFRVPKDVESALPNVKATTQEMELADRLLDALAQNAFDPARYKDHYAEKLRHLVDARIKGEEIELVPEEEEPVTLDFGKALRKSVAQAKKPTVAKGTARLRPRRKKVS